MQLHANTRESILYILNVTEKCEYVHASCQNKDKILSIKGLGSSEEWKVRSDYTNKLTMPQRIMISDQIPDLVTWSDIAKKTIT